MFNQSFFFFRKTFLTNIVWHWRAGGESYFTITKDFVFSNNNNNNNSYSFDSPDFEGGKIKALWSDASSYSSERQKIQHSDPRFEYAFMTTDFFYVMCFLLFHKN